MTRRIIRRSSLVTPYRMARPPLPVFGLTLCSTSCDCDFLFWLTSGASPCSSESIVAAGSSKAVSDNLEKKRLASDEVAIFCFLRSLTIDRSFFRLSEHVLSSLRQAAKENPQPHGHLVLLHHENKTVVTSSLIPFRLTSGSSR